MIDNKLHIPPENIISSKKICNKCGYLCTATFAGDGKLLIDDCFRLFMSNIPIEACVAKKQIDEGIPKSEARNQVKKGDRIC